MAAPADASHAVRGVRVGHTSREQVFPFMRVVVGHGGRPAAGSSVVAVSLVLAHADGVASEDGVPGVGPGLAAVAALGGGAALLVGLPFVVVAAAPIGQHRARGDGAHLPGFTRAHHAPRT